MVNRYPNDVKGRLKYAYNTPDMGNHLSNYLITPLFSGAAVAVNSIIYGGLKAAEKLLHSAGDAYYSFKESKADIGQDPQSKATNPVFEKHLHFRQNVSSALGFSPVPHKPKPKQKNSFIENLKQYQVNYPTDNDFEYDLNNNLTMPVAMIAARIISVPLNGLVSWYGLKKPPEWQRPKWADVSPQGRPRLTDEEVKAIEKEYDQEVERFDYMRAKNKL